MERIGVEPFKEGSMHVKVAAGKVPRGIASRWPGTQAPCWDGVYARALTTLCGLLPRLIGAQCLRARARRDPNGTIPHRGRRGPARPLLRAGG